MADQRVGLRRLYDALGCSLAESSELCLKFSLGANSAAQVYFGPRPSLGISVHEAGDGFVVPGESACMVRVEHQADASQSSYPRKFFNEVRCELHVEISDDLAAAFRAKDKDAEGAILKLAESHRRALDESVEFLTGIIGIRFHRQFVIKVICENVYALREDGPIIQGCTPWVEILERVSLNSLGGEALGQVLAACGQTERRTQKFAGRVLRWLLRAWSERDPVSKFVFLFIPLEMILEPSERGEDKPEWTVLKDLVNAQSSEQSKSLLEFLNSLKNRDQPSLNERFHTMARLSGCESWQADVQAFRRFNALRNRLLHGGDRDISFQITVGENEATELGDLAERYVSYCLFRDMKVYPSRWRARTP